MSSSDHSSHLDCVISCTFLKSCPALNFRTFRTKSIKIIVLRSHRFTDIMNLCMNLNMVTVNSEQHKTSY